MRPRGTIARASATTPSVASAHTCLPRASRRWRWIYRGNVRAATRRVERCASSTSKRATGPFGGNPSARYWTFDLGDRKGKKGNLPAGSRGDVMDALLLRMRSLPFPHHALGLIKLPGSQLFRDPVLCLGGLLVFITGCPRCRQAEPEIRLNEVFRNPLA